MKNFILFLIICTPSLSYAAYSEEYIQKSIKNENVYYCFEGDSNLKFAFDQYRGRITHFPFKQYNKVKLLRSERIDDENPVFKNTYAELKRGRQIAMFSITLQHNDVWDAEYKLSKTNKETSLKEARFNLVRLSSMCYADLNNSD